jgi:hypothetical protein
MKMKLKLITTIIALASATVYATPLTVLIEVEREKIADAVQSYHSDCDGRKTQECTEKRDALVKALREFVPMLDDELNALSGRAKNATPPPGMDERVFAEAEREFRQECANRERAMHAYKKWAGDAIAALQGGHALPSTPDNLTGWEARPEDWVPINVDPSTGVATPATPKDAERLNAVTKAQKPPQPSEARFFSVAVGNDTKHQSSGPNGSGVIVEVSELDGLTDANVRNNWGTVGNAVGAWGWSDEKLKVGDSKKAAHYATDGCTSLAINGYIRNDKDNVFMVARGEWRKTPLGDVYFAIVQRTTKKALPQR